MYQQGMLAFLHTGKELSDVRDELSLIEDIFKRLFDFETTEENWRETIPLWKLFYNLEMEVKNPVAKYILRQAYHENIAKDIGMAIQLKPTRGNPPEGLMIRLKELTECLRDQYIKIITALNEEEGRVDALKELQGSFESRIFALFVAFGIGIANFISTYIYDKYFGETYYDFNIEESGATEGSDYYILIG